ncbi:peptide chain release factor [Schizosaccharomyces japonicus yFS275]|uniref:Peptide chain release factor n=1 Tax=Schizosaccharomyces japonicus (strain yFS275 / FY16936) TaxID=402676 RepID=B6JY59_SCHJY|nr:peptide chain release factor [Schizosaccharomyces japonicus yFS275]EEB06477.2 peptide chain release factor [Schizosaccharomyces japonicus yFS275]
MNFAQKVHFLGVSGLRVRGILNKRFRNVPVRRFIDSIATKLCLSESEKQLLEFSRLLCQTETKLHQKPHQLSQNESKDHVLEQLSVLPWKSICSTYQTFQVLTKQLRELGQFMNDESDKELLQLAESENNEIMKKTHDVLEGMHKLLSLKPNNYQAPALLEVRAGVGGSEAALFASELLSMYERYCAFRNWKWKPLSLSKTENGNGITEAIVSVSGHVYGELFHEAGVHRVQRTPATETKGRLHTSTVSVIVLPTVNSQTLETESKLDANDIRVDVMRAKGAGGQHVNRTESAVRLTHIPSGITVCMQDSRSQHENKERALLILRSRVAALRHENLQKQQHDARRKQVSSPVRSEKIRTYNYAQNRITDHRCSCSMYDTEGFMEGSKQTEQFFSRIRNWFSQQQFQLLLQNLRMLHDTGTNPAS